MPSTCVLIRMIYKQYGNRYIIYYIYIGYMAHEKAKAQTFRQQAAV